jgi:hypothetical protein
MNINWLFTLWRASELRWPRHWTVRPHFDEHQMEKNMIGPANLQNQIRTAETATKSVSLRHASGRKGDGHRQKAPTGF